jgi:putative phage-type endonuclease
VTVAADPIVLVPGTPEWVREMTGSKVAAVLGLSPWQSRFSLWYEMRGATGHETGGPEMARGHYMEDGICRWVADEHDLYLTPGGCWRNRARPWQVASPDRLARPDNVHEVTGGDEPTGVVEVKTAAAFERWGRDGTDEIPAHVRAQAVWQCDTLGVDTAYVGVLLPYLELRSYVIHPAPGEVEFIREECRAFLDSLAAGEPPDVDQWTQTYDTLRALNPKIDGTDTEVPPELARDYARAVLALRAAEDEHVLRRNQLAQHMGMAQRARYADRTLANRQPGPTGVPYVKAGSERVLRAVTQRRSRAWRWTSSCRRARGRCTARRSRRW